MSREKYPDKLSSNYKPAFRTLINSTFMKKYILILNACELMKKLLSGKRVEGVLFIDENTGKLTFKAYNRNPQVRYRDRLLKKLPWGWVKESPNRIKVHHSFPKSLTTAQMIISLDHETSEAKDVMVNRELDLIEFC